MRQANEFLRRASAYFAQAARAQSSGAVQAMIAFIDNGGAVHGARYLRIWPISKVLIIAAASMYRSSILNGLPKQMSSGPSAMSAAELSQRFDHKTINDLLEGRGDPPAGPMAVVRGRRICRARMGRLAQPPAAA